MTNELTGYSLQDCAVCGEEYDEADLVIGVCFDCHDNLAHKDLEEQIDELLNSGSRKEKTTNGNA